ncbi:MAG: DinB family protein [Planctomycetota bacterium]|jgi:uncharacterized damage-inducible protein DinB
MVPEAKVIWSALEFRKPMLLRNVEPLDEAQMRWRPAADRNSIAWQLWHIAEVEDNWICALVTGEPLRFPFGAQVRAATENDYPSKAQLLDYLHEVRGLTKPRLEALQSADFERQAEDPDFGKLTVLDVWTGVVTSFAWHAGQIALTAKLLPGTPVTTMQFGYWREWGSEKTK